MVATLLPLLIAAGIGSSAQSGRIFSGAYGPKGDICFIGGPVVWEVWPEKADRTVTKTVITLDGKTLAGTYDAAGQRLTAKLPANLFQGPHEVRCHIELSDRTAYDKAWEFTYRQESTLDVPTASESARSGLEAVNRVRESLGLPEAIQNNALDFAARMHAHYLAVNRDSGHTEILGKASFFGLDPGMRIARTGYVGPTFECVETGSATFAESVPRLFDAPLHRIPFLQPGQIEIGAALEGNRTTIEFSLTRTRGTVVSPGPAQKDVAISWQNNEIPDPLEGMGAPLTVGYPIVIAHFEPDVRSDQRPARLLDPEGEIVDCYTVAKDLSMYGYRLLVPKRPLARATTYTIVYTGRDLLGGVREMQSTFTTAK